ncbi:MAG: hypothetical protein AABY00_03910 [Nanoarchaeota archaeon]
MKEEKINQFLKDKKLVKKIPDIEIVKSLIISAEETMDTQLQIPLTEKSATSIFRETYESLRQIGDSLWWQIGYETQTHDASIESIKDSEFLSSEQKVKTNSLDRFRTIRHDANYRGFKVSIVQAQEIIEFWKFVGKPLLLKIKKTMRHPTLKGRV